MRTLYERETRKETKIAENERRLDQNLSNTAQTELPFDETAVAVGHKNRSHKPSYIRVLEERKGYRIHLHDGLGVHKTKSAAIGKMYHRRLQTFPPNET